MKYSIFIPYIQKDMDTERIKVELNNHLLGEIEGIDIITTHHKYNKAFIHYNNWNVTDANAYNIKNILDQGTFCRIYIISINKYWKLLKNKSTKVTTKSPFELTIKKPTLTNKENGFHSSSILDNLLKIDNDISLFEKMIGGDKPKLNNSLDNHNNESNKIQKLEDRITKLENIIYNRYT